jgi:hypothetical protein
MSSITIYGIQSETEFPNLCASNFYDDPYARYHYDYLKDVDASDKDLAEELAHLLGGTDAEGITVDQDDYGWYLAFTQEAIDRYFHEMYIAFRDNVYELQKIGDPEPLKRWVNALSNLEHTYSDYWGSMIFSWEDGWMTPQEFMRSVEPETRYYITGAVDAHV